MGDYRRNYVFNHGYFECFRERNTSNKGQVVDAAMIEGVPALMSLIHTFMAQRIGVTIEVQISLMVGVLTTNVTRQKIISM